MRDILTMLENAPHLANVANFKLIVFLDGLEHLSDDPSSISQWMPEKLPKNVQVLISTNPLSKLSRFVKGRSDKIDSIRIEELNWTDRKQITAHYLKNFGKSLTDSAFDNQLVNQSFFELLYRPGQANLQFSLYELHTM